MVPTTISSKDLIRPFFGRLIINTVLNIDFPLEIVAVKSFGKQCEQILVYARLLNIECLKSFVSFADILMIASLEWIIASIHEAAGIGLLILQI